MIRAAPFCALALAACLPRSTYTACKTDGDCASAGPGPRCESNGACSVTDPTCPSGHRYGGSAPQANTCVPGDAYDAPLADGGADAHPAAPGQECLVGKPIPSQPGCIAMVDAKDPRCGTELWDKVCVRWAEALCKSQCSQMVFVGTDQNAFVMRLSDNAILWEDNSFDGSPAGAWADFDGDGDPDLAVVGESQIRIFENKGYDAAGGSLVLDPIFSTQWATLDPGFGYFAGNDVEWGMPNGPTGLPGVAFGGSGGLVIVQQQDNGVFLAETPLESTMSTGMDADPPSPGVDRIAWGDFDGDGWQDLAIGYWQYPVELWKNSNGTLAKTPYTPTSEFAPDFDQGLEWCNLEKDNPYPQLAIGGDDFVAIADNIGGTVSTSLTVLDHGGASDIACADFDGDGDLDLVVSGDDNAPARAFRNAGALTSFAQTWADSTTTTDTRLEASTAVGDLDGDGKLDFMTSFDDTNAPVELQTFHDTSITDEIQFSSGAHTTLSQQAQSARRLALAPAIGKP